MTLADRKSKSPTFCRAPPLYSVLIIRYSLSDFHHFAKLPFGLTLSVLIFKKIPYCFHSINFLYCKDLIDHLKIYIGSCCGYSSCRPYSSEVNLLSHGTHLSQLFAPFRNIGVKAILLISWDSPFVIICSPFGTLV